MILKKLLILSALTVTFFGKDGLEELCEALKQVHTIKPEMEKEYEYFLKRGRTKQVNNTQQSVGAVMRYYCDACGGLSQSLSESDVWTEVRPLCVSCQDLEIKNWLYIFILNKNKV